MSNGFEEALHELTDPMPVDERPCLCDQPDDGMAFVARKDCPKCSSAEYNPLPCFKCGRQLEDASGGSQREWQNQPYAGTTFHSEGQYGSTVWDPMNQYVRYTIELNICDVCLREASEAQEAASDARRATILLTEGYPQPTQWRSTPWDYRVDHRAVFD